MHAFFINKGVTVKGEIGGVTVWKEHSIKKMGVTEGAIDELQ